MNNNNPKQNHKICILDTLSNLMEQSQRGDAVAYQSLLEASSNMLKFYFRNKTIAKQDVDDLVQESLLALHQARHSYRIENPFSAWLFGIAKHKLYNYFSTKKKEHHKTTCLIQNSYSQHSYEDLSDETWQVLQLGLDQLNPLQKQCVILKQVEGLSVKDISSIIHKSEAATKVLLHRSYKALRHILNDMLCYLIVNMYFKDIGITS